MRNLLLSGRPTTSPEQDLWCGVIFQALRDASRLSWLEFTHEERTKAGKPMQYHLERDLDAARQAMRWLTNPSEDLSEVCGLAGIEVSGILARRDKFLAGQFEGVESL